MPSPIPKPLATRQRRNRTSTAAHLEAAAARRIELPARYSPWKCVANVDSKRGCTLSGGNHDLEHFAKAEIEPHDFDAAEVAWHRMTVRWWATIWDSPMAGEWVEADVPALLVVAALVDDFWSTGDPKRAAEIRLQQREFGLSPLSRRQLQWEVKRLESTAKPADVNTPTRSRDPRLRALG